MQLMIEKNIPVPRQIRSAHSLYKYPFHLLDEGDSVFIAKSYADPKSIRAALSNRTRQDRDLLGRKFTTRSVTENGVEGLRIWRLEA